MKINNKKTCYNLSVILFILGIVFFVCTLFYDFNNDKLYISVCNLPSFESFKLKDNISKSNDLTDCYYDDFKANFVCPKSVSDYDTTLLAIKDCVLDDSDKETCTNCAYISISGIKNFFYKDVDFSFDTLNNTSKLLLKIRGKICHQKEKFSYVKDIKINDNMVKEDEDFYSFLKKYETELPNKEHNKISFKTKSYYRYLLSFLFLLVFIYIFVFQIKYIKRSKKISIIRFFKITFKYYVILAACSLILSLSTNYVILLILLIQLILLNLKKGKK